MHGMVLLAQIVIGDIPIDVVRKDIKNLHLSVHRPDGRVRISAPLRMDMEAIKVFALSKLAWIRKQRARLLARERGAPRDYADEESHYYLGKRYLLKIIETNAARGVIINHDTMEMYVRAATSREKRRLMLESWYRRQLKEIIPGYVVKYEHMMRVTVREFAVKRMRTRWGTCNTRAGRIWINLELIKRPLHCIEYIVVHEMVHLLERRHNKVFAAYMDTFLPAWRAHKEELNKGPLAHEHWIE